MPEPMPHVGLYPGTFDPITRGHLDVIARGARLVERLVVGVAANVGKQPLMTLEERVECVTHEVKPIAADTGTVIEVVGFDKLLVQCARQNGANVIIRGLRVVTDYDYETQMFGMNHRLDPGIETIFLMATERYQFISSRLVKEIAQLGGDITSFVPSFTHSRIIARLR
ncbi:pantetheine-phosphate adenylyltransferase [Lichenicola cladoniae]|uniref:Phosphopantetheine adenylyltransferase n=1 Tax=Lichenicola cladoniae TaxID=1484109 RepID=A0A6M8HPG9_9PROT|nr:pantetheine-phosphate adenylyltransferase [Lichenicola cladoniae]NPD66390.1 pantetheine-phosphate adenylyltransferase [Acetobacteraceae bacterium]QKE90369.1 pantetheine-phosphate adenylyltransferase [Lichenicola cladoniae]